MRGLGRLGRQHAVVVGVGRIGTRREGRPVRERRRWDQSVKARAKQDKTRRNMSTARESKGATAIFLVYLSTRSLWWRGSVGVGSGQQLRPPSTQHVQYHKRRTHRPPLGATQSTWPPSTIRPCSACGWSFVVVVVWWRGKDGWIWHIRSTLAPHTHLTARPHTHTLHARTHAHAMHTHIPSWPRGSPGS